MWPWVAAAIATGGLVVGTTAVVRHRRHRDRMYAELACLRDSTVERYPAHVMATTDRAQLAADFARDMMVRIPQFLSPECLAALRSEAMENLPRVERSFIPTHKKGGTLCYETISRHAPRCLSFYHSSAVREWVQAITGERVVPTRDQDQSSLSILCYNEAGDHINWHFDHNFYRGRHFTVLLSLTNESPTGGVSQSRLQRRTPAGEVVELDTAANTLVVFEGARVLHRASPTGPGDVRLMLSMTYCTDSRIHWSKEFFRRVKDTAYYGMRALWD
jgi:hypothetical protein